MRRFTKACLITCAVSVVFGGAIAAVAAGMGGNVTSAGWPAGSRGKDIAEEISGKFLGLYREIFEYPDISRDDVDEIKDGIREGIREGVEGIKEGVRDGLRRDIKFDDGDESFDPASSDGQPMEEEAAASGGNTLRFPGKEVRTLKLQVNRGKAVIFADSGSDDITVSGSADNAMETGRDEKGQLKVKVGADRWWLNRDASQVAVYIHVPEGFRFDKVEFKSESGKRNWRDKGPSIKADGLSADRLELDADVGAIVITGGDVGKLEISSEVASVNYEGSVSREVEADCDVGAVELSLTGAATDYNYNMKCDLGVINVDGSAFKGLSGKRTIDNGASKRMELKCDTGSIKVDFK